MTSKRAQIEDPRVRKLVDGIIEAQVREIREMKELIGFLDKIELLAVPHAASAMAFA